MWRCENVWGWLARGSRNISDRILPRVAAIAPISVFLLVYTPAVGHGFVKDDFAWIERSIVASPGDIPTLFVRHTGFYRPVVSFTFAIDHFIFGLKPWGYGFTNLILVLCAAFGVFKLFQASGLPMGAAYFGATLWMLNFHGINMAVLWISGRTALLLTLFAAATGFFLLKRRVGAALVCLLASLLSKEEAVVLPPLMMAWLLVLDTGTSASRRSVLARWAVASACLLILYGFARYAAGAMTPSTAPYYYRFTFEPAVVARNAFEYLDRAGTLAAMVTVIALVVLDGDKDRELLKATLRSRRMLCGAVWVCATYSITLFLPIRSSLYACLPSVGACMIAAAAVASAWPNSTRRRQRTALAGAAVLAVIAGIIHQTRTTRWTEIADLTSDALPAIERLTAALPNDATAVLYDDITTRRNLRSAFGTALNQAFALRNERRLNLWIEPPLDEFVLAGHAGPCDSCVRLRLALVNGVIVPK